MHKIEGNDIYLTYGNDLNITIPILQADGKTPYVIQNGDVVDLKVRVKPFTGIGPAPSVVMHGAIEIIDGSPVWKISKNDSRIPCKSYTWDARIVQADGSNCNYAEGKLIILPVNTK